MLQGAGIGKCSVLGVESSRSQLVLDRVGLCDHRELPCSRKNVVHTIHCFETGISELLIASALSEASILPWSAAAYWNAALFSYSVANSVLMYSRTSGRTRFGALGARVRFINIQRKPEVLVNIGIVRTGYAQLPAHEVVLTGNAFESVHFLPREGHICSSWCRICQRTLWCCRGVVGRITTVFPV